MSHRLVSSESGESEKVTGLCPNGAQQKKTGRSKQRRRGRRVHAKQLTTLHCINYALLSQPGVMLCSISI